MNKITTIKIRREVNLESLNLPPLAIAKYFYKKGITSHLSMQKLIYFAFLEGLRNDLLLFHEKFQAWRHGPVLRSVFEAMTGSTNLDALFTKALSLRQKKILTVLKKTYQNYGTLDTWDLVDKSHQGPWQKTRGELPETEISTQEIALEELISFAGA